MEDSEQLTEEAPMNPQRKPLLRFLTLALGLVLLIPLLAHALHMGSGQNSLNETIFGPDLSRNAVYLSFPFLAFAMLASFLYFGVFSWRRSGVIGPPWHDPKRWKE